MNIEQNLSLPTEVKQWNSTGSVRSPKKIIERLGKIELQVLGQVSKKVQCPSSAKYCSEGLLHCTCGIRIMHSSRSKVNSRSCLFRITSGQRTTHEVQGMLRPNGNLIIGKRKEQSEMRKRKDTVPSCNGGKMTNCTEILKLPSDGRTIVDIWIQLRQLTSRIPRQEVSAQDMRMILRLESMIRDQNQD